jgi:hypothetical protein
VFKSSAIRAGDAPERSRRRSTASLSESGRPGGSSSRADAPFMPICRQFGVEGIAGCLGSFVLGMRPLTQSLEDGAEGQGSAVVTNRSFAVDTWQRAITPDAAESLGTGEVARCQAVLPGACVFH